VTSVSFCVPGRQEGVSFYKLLLRRKDDFCCITTGVTYILATYKPAGCNRHKPNTKKERVTMKTSTVKKPRAEKNGVAPENKPGFRVVSKDQKANAEPSATGWQGISRVNLAGIAKTGESRKAEKYPTLADPDGTVARHVDQLIELQAQLDQTEGAIKLIKADLIATARPFYFTYCNGKADVPSSVSALNGGGEALINFQNRYSGL